MRPRSALLTALLILPSGCGGSDRGGFGEAPPPLNTAPPPATASEPPREPRRLSVTALGGLRFEPDRLTSVRGRPLELELRNADAQEHSLIVEGLPVAMLAGAGQSVRASAIPSRAGSYPFFCGIADHRELGMEGVIRVRPA